MPLQAFPQVISIAFLRSYRQMAVDWLCIKQGRCVLSGELAAIGSLVAQPFAHLLAKAGAGIVESLLQLSVALHFRGQFLPQPAGFLGERVALLADLRVLGGRRG